MSDKRSGLVLILFLVSAIVVLALSFYTGYSLNALMGSLEQSRSERLRAEALGASLIVSTEELQSIQSAEALLSGNTAAIQNRLSGFAALHNLTEVAFIRQLPSGDLQYIISSNAGAGIYDVSAPVFASTRMLDVALSGAIVVEELSESAREEVRFMAFAPVMDSEGAVVAIAAVGVDDQMILDTASSIRNLTIILLVCIFIVILAACANVLLQVRKEQELEESIRIQKLMIEISQKLSSESPFDNRVNEAIALLGSYLETSRVSVINVSEPDVGNSLKYIWTDKDSRIPQPTEQQALTLYQTMRDLFDSGSSVRHSAVNCSNINQIKGEHHALLKALKTRSFIWSPFYVQNKLWGVLALEFSKPRGSFPKKDIQLIESVTTDMVDALIRELYSEQREQALNHAVHASEVKSEFLSNMSHEMRTPMNAIIGMTSIALSSDEAERKDYCLGHIKDASSHLLNIISDVLDMTSIQENEFSLKLAPFDFRGSLKAVVHEHVHKITEQKISFRVSVDESIPKILVGDNQRLSKVVSNLLSNAIKFTPSGGNVVVHVEHLSAGPEDHKLKFVIEDDGIGISDDAKDNLFRPFGQADSGANRKYGGTGLGLAIARHLVEMMGGTVGVESELDVGSKFYFTVTLQDESTVSVDNAQPEELPAVAELEEAPVELELEELSAQDGPVEVPVEPVEPVEVELLPEQDELDWLLIEDRHVVSGEQEEQGEEDLLEDEPLSDLSLYRILLAEDIEINREVVIALLDGSNITIDCAVSGLEALEAIKNNPDCYDLVFMDIQMPEMDGLDATRCIRALPYPQIEKLPIIAMTANVFKEDIEACLKAGMNDHIGKPINLDELYCVLNKYLPEKD